jgi:hypothetical protein
MLNANPDVDAARAEHRIAVRRSSQGGGPRPVAPPQPNGTTHHTMVRAQSDGNQPTKQVVTKKNINVP